MVRIVGSRALEIFFHHTVGSSLRIGVRPVVVGLPEIVGAGCVAFAAAAAAAITMRLRGRTTASGRPPAAVHLREFTFAVHFGSHRRIPLHRCVGRRARQACSHRTAARSVRPIGHRLHRWHPTGACCDRRCRRSGRAAARSIGRQPRRQLRRRRPHKQMRAVLVSAPKPEP